MADRKNIVWAGRSASLSPRIGENVDETALQKTIDDATSLYVVYVDRNDNADE